ncbi:MAG TPA: T9SS type A sorting domain-containing protein, partial [Candidatus Eisenbacteria bacterium]|nr:T9SS type A sorting domain-containing protein [Candidatus Eisenbacteria bacterium]
AGGPLAGEVLCADVDGDFRSDLVALRTDGTLLAWDAALVPLPAFPRYFPYGVTESPAILDGSTHRFAAVADTAGRLWSVPVGPPLGPAPWPTASGGAGRSRAMGFFQGTPVHPQVHAFVWKWETDETGSLCWSGTNLSEVYRLRVRSQGALSPLAETHPVDEGCLHLEDRRPGERLILEGQDRSGVWSELSHLVIERPARLVAGMPVPNPFRSETRFTVSGAVGPVRVQILDIQGRVVWDRAANGTDIRWSGTDMSGMRVPPGLYFVRVTDGTSSITRRVLRL